MLVFPTFLVVQLVIASFISLTVKADSSVACGDALKRSTKLCKRWKNSGMCGEANVRAFCQQSCDQCKDKDNVGENDEAAAPHKYLGCFKDGVQSELKLMSLSLPVTVRSCVEACRLKSFKFAGLRNGKFCMCSNDYGSHGEVLTRYGCLKTCGSREACGGAMENALYQADCKKENKKHYCDEIEELVLGKKKKNLLSKRISSHRSHVKMVVPKTRSWDFDSWIRQYEEQKENDY